MSLRSLFLILTFAFALPVRADAPATQPSPIDPKLLERMVEIDSRAAQIKSLTGDFEQKKFTALLRKPLVSAGKIRVQGSTMRWDTEKPEPSVLLLSQTEVKMYYPSQKTLEIYRVDQKLGQLAASPLPRLEALKEHFSFEQIPAKSIDESADESKFLALQMKPIQPELQKHLDQVRVLLDIGGAYIVQAEMTDADGDRTSIAFRNIKTNADVGEMELRVPESTTISRPLEAIENAGEGPSK